MNNTALYLLCMLLVSLISGSVEAQVDQICRLETEQNPGQKLSSSGQRWAQFLPEVVVGFDYRPDWRTFGQAEGDGFAVPFLMERWVGHHHHDKMTRFTVGLRWSARPGREEVLMPGRPLVARSCRAWRYWNRQQSLHLEGAIVGWSERSRWEALLRAQGRM